MRLCLSHPQHGEAAVMVWQRTVTPPTKVIIGSIPIFSTKFWSHSISVSIAACHAVEASSTLAGTAKTCQRKLWPRRYMYMPSKEISMSHWNKVLQVRELRDRSLSAQEISKRLCMTVEDVQQILSDLANRVIFAND